VSSENGSGEFSPEIEAKLSKEDTKAGRLQRAVLRVLKEHEDDGALPTSARFIFYELEGRGVVPKVYIKADGTVAARTPAQDVADALYHVREKDIVPWAWVVDETRDLKSWEYAADAYVYVTTQLEYFRLDLWGGEPPPLVLCESRSLAGILRNITSTYLCPIAATNGQVRGFLHTDIGPLIARAKNTQRIFYLGDLDYSGGQIEANTREVLEEYGGLEWEKVAITKQQAEEKNLTVIKKPDKRFRPVQYFDAIETEALRQVEIQRILRARLSAELPEPLEGVRVREDKQRAGVLVKLERTEPLEALPKALQPTNEVPDYVVESIKDEVETRIRETLNRVDNAVYESEGKRMSWIQKARLREEIMRRLTE